MESAPAYSGGLPAYVDSPFLPPQPPPTDSKPAPQSVWIQDTDISGLYRKRYILPADDELIPSPPPAIFDSVSPPSYTTTREPLYTIKTHGRPSPLDFRGTQPDFTIYLGDGDSGPVVATGILHTTPLKKSLGELRFFPRVSHQPGGESSSSSASKDIPGATLKELDSGKKYAFSASGHDLEWAQTGPGERPPTPPPPPQPEEEEKEEEEKSPGLLSKLKRKSSKKKKKKPKPSHPDFLPPRDTKTWELTAHEPATGTLTRIATYRELQPLGMAIYRYRATPAKYPDGHMARLDVHEPTFGVPGSDARELAVVSIMLLVEAQRRKSLSSGNRSWLDGAVGFGHGCGGGGGCGGGS